MQKIETRCQAQGFIPTNVVDTRESLKEEKIRKIGHIYKETFQGSRSDS